MKCDIELVAAVSKNMVIGRNRTLPWRIPEDLQHFKELTKDHIVVMGKNTYFSLPKAPLPDRINIVVTSSPDVFVARENVMFVRFSELEEVLEDISCEFPNKRCFVIGGYKLYAAMLPLASKLHITHIDKVIPDGDTTFPCFCDFEIQSYSERLVSTHEQCAFQYITYVRASNLGKMIVNDMRYLKLLNTLLVSGSPRSDRTGTGTISMFAKQLRFDITQHVPLLTTKFVPWKACIKELLWFLKGQTDASILQEQGVRIWDGNTSRAFLDTRGLGDYPEGDIGCGYGFQWRHFGAEYTTCKGDYNGQGFDQIKFIINELKNDPFSRRIYMSSWNPLHMHKMALPPCHISAQFFVEESDGKKWLSCHMYQRSVDSFLGLPFNIFSYTALTYILATLCDMHPKELIISTGDTHIYQDHIEQVKEQIQRSPITPPKLIVNHRIKDIPIEDISIDDFDIVGYFHHNTLKGKMSV